MTFRAIPRTGLPASSSPFRVVDEQERELEWINRFLDALCVRGIAPLTLRSYANQLLHFVRWWSRQPGVDVTGPALRQFTESTLIDYVRDQVNEVPKPSPENINQRAGMLRRLYRFHFQQDMPHAPYLIPRNWYRRSPLGYGRRIAASSADLKVKVPQRVVTPLSREQVHRFWHSFRTARDLAMVALMLLNGLRSREVLELQLEDVLFSEAQLRVRGKGRRVRLLPLPPETMGLLRCYLKSERPLTNAPEVFVALKGRARWSAEARRVAESVPASSFDQRSPAGQSASLPAHLWGRHDPRRGQPAGSAKTDGACPHPHHAVVHTDGSAGRVRRIRSRGPAHDRVTTAALRMSTPPHPLEQALQARVELLATTLRPSTAGQYRQTVRLFMRYLRPRCPEVRRPDQLRRDPHLLGWFEYLWVRVGKRGERCSNTTRGAYLIRLRKLFDLLGDHRFPPRPGLVLSQDIPRPDQVLPRPLRPEDDARLIEELRRRNDPLSNALLLTRWTGMRIGETADLGVDCLQYVGGEHWAVHVPLGKLHNDRLVPVSEEVREVIARLEFFRTLPPAAPPEFLLPRPKGREVLCSELREALGAAAQQAGIRAPIVPHQLRHTYATSMLRAGVSMPAVMKLLGHRTANMTLRYVEVTQNDLQREFHLARQHPRHLVPVPAVAAPDSDPDSAGPAAVAQRLSSTIRALDLYRQQAGVNHDSDLRLLLRRLVRTRSRFEKLTQG
ncbi:MAG TPA: tyrosine-type recombinase/integrase [Bryobacteraceae bacterium]